MSTCMFCGFCERYGCEHYAKSSPQTVLLPVLLKDPNFTLRTQCQVLRINLDSAKKQATGVVYVDGSGREFEQPAKLVDRRHVRAEQRAHDAALGHRQAVRPGEPAAASSAATTRTRRSAARQVFFDQSVNINPFMRSGASGTVISDFVSDNFDHGPLGFVGGAYVGEVMSHGRPIEFHPVPPGTPAWGSAWKRAVAEHYNHTSSINVHGSSVADHATTTSTSIRPTRTRGACRCCA